MLNLVEGFIDLVQMLMDLLCKQLYKHNLSTGEAWVYFTNVFEPWLSSSFDVYDHSSISNPPWRNTVKEAVAGSMIAKGFVRLSERLHECSMELSFGNPDVMDLALNFISQQIFPLAPDYVVKSVSDELVRTEHWKDWIVTHSSLKLLISIQDKSSGSFLSVLACRAQWSKALESIDVKKRSSFLFDVMHLVLLLLWEATIPLPNTFCRFLKEDIVKLDWSVLEPNEYARIVQVAEGLMEANGGHDRILILFKLVGNITGLEQMSRLVRLQRSDVACNSSVLDALEKECLLLNCIKKPLGSLHGLTVKTERDLLKISPASFVMVLYWSLRRVKIAILADTEVSKWCKSYHEIVEFSPLRPFPLYSLVTMTMGLLNLPGVVFIRPVRPREERDYATVSTGFLVLS